MKLVIFRLIFLNLMITPNPEIFLSGEKRLVILLEFLSAASLLNNSEFKGFTGVFQCLVIFQ